MCTNHSRAECCVSQSGCNIFVFCSVRSLFCFCRQLFAAYHVQYYRVYVTMKFLHAQILRHALGICVCLSSQFSDLCDCGTVCNCPLYSLQCESRGISYVAAPYALPFTVVLIMWDALGWWVWSDCFKVGVFYQWSGISKAFNITFWNRAYSSFRWLF